MTGYIHHSVGKSRSGEYAYCRHNYYSPERCCFCTYCRIDEIDCIIANNDAMALGVIEALKQNNVDMSSIAIVSVDGTNAGLQAIRDGEMLATVHQDAVGQASGAVQAAINLAGSADLMAGISYEQDEDNSFVIWVPFEPVTADNVDDFN